MAMNSDDIYSWLLNNFPSKFSFDKGTTDPTTAPAIVPSYFLNITNEKLWFYSGTTKGWKESGSSSSASASVGDWKLVNSNFTSIITAPWLAAGSTFNTSTYPIFKTKFTSVSKTETTPSPGQNGGLGSDYCYFPKDGKFYASGITNSINVYDPTANTTTRIIVGTDYSQSVSANSSYVFMAPNASNKLYRSANGTDWEYVTISGVSFSSYVKVVCSGNYVVICDGTSTTKYYKYSTDNGNTWQNAMTPPINGNISNVNGIFTLLQADLVDRNTVYYTTDLLTWQTITMPVSGAFKFAYSVGLNRYIAHNRNVANTKIYYSSDWTTWATNSTALPSNNYSAVGACNNGFVAISYSGTSYYSFTGTDTWTALTSTIVNPYNVSSDGNTKMVWTYYSSGTQIVTLAYPATGTVPSAPSSQTNATWYIYGG